MRNILTMVIKVNFSSKFLQDGGSGDERLEGFIAYWGKRRQNPKD